jgi:hypothetical protein
MDRTRVDALEHGEVKLMAKFIQSHLEEKVGITVSRYGILLMPTAACLLCTDRQLFRRAHANI